MRVVFDTNVLLSVLIAPGSMSDALNNAWRDHRFQLTSCDPRIEEFGRVTAVSVETRGIVEAMKKAAR